MRMAELRAGGAVALARGCLGTCAESAIRHAILHAGKPVDSMDGLEQDHTQNRADARDGLQALEGLPIVLLGRLDERPREVAEQPIIIVKQGEIDFDTPHGRHSVACGQEQK